ncbi:glycosyltransferase family 4 protein [Candidatus Uabimicrobium sp. HlEnr_7]|uniref:glycosyltransferase family 4 protein n=1 Tax=Candidatus Uabimicrobium helgolandensis TaxID=3095367 RepID=UPI003556526F
MKILILHIKDLRNDFCIFRETAKSFLGFAQVTEAFLKESAVSTQGINIHEFHFPKKDLKKTYVVKEMQRFLQQENFDIVIAHRYRAIQILSRASKHLNFIKIGVFHGLNNLSFSKKRFLNKNTSDFHFTCVSQAVKDYLVKNKISEQKCSVIYNAINICGVKKKQYSRTQARRELQLDSNDFIYAMVGRMSTQKGYEYLLPAFSKVCNDYPQVKLCIIGSGRKKIYKYIKNFAQKYKLEKNIVLKGYIPNAYKYMGAFDTLVLPSTSEGFGIVLLEAMCAQIPIIASSAGGIPEVLQSQNYIFETENVTELHKAMSNIFSNSNQKTRYEKLQKDFCIEKHYAAYRNIIKMLRNGTIK